MQASLKIKSITIEQIYGKLQSAIIFLFFLFSLVGLNLVSKKSLVFFILMLIPYAIANYQKILKSLWPAYSLLIFFLFYFSSYFWSLVPDVSKSFMEAQFLLLLFVLILNVKSQEQDIFVLFKYAIATYIFIVITYCISSPGSAVEGTQLRAYYPNKNNLGVMMAISTLVLWFAPGREKWQVYLGLLSFALMCASQSKTAGAVFFLAILFYALIGLIQPYFYPKQKKRELGDIHIIVVLRYIIHVTILLGILLLVVYRDVFLNFLWRNINYDLFTGRGELWVTVIQHIKQNSLLGIGPGVFWNAEGASEANQTYVKLLEPAWVEELGSADGSYIDMIASIGMVGFALFLWVILNAYRKLFSQFGNEVTCIYFISLTFALIHAITESTLLGSTNLLWAVFLLAYFNLSSQKNKHG